MARLPPGTPIGFGLGTGQGGHDGCYHYHYDVTTYDEARAPLLVDVQVGQVHRWYDVHVDHSTLCEKKGPRGRKGKFHGLQCLNLLGPPANNVGKTTRLVADIGTLQEWAQSFAAVWKKTLVAGVDSFWTIGPGAALLEKLGKITDTDLLQSFKGAGWIYSFNVGMRDPLLGHNAFLEIYQALLSTMGRSDATIPGGFLLFDFKAKQGGGDKAKEQTAVLDTGDKTRIPETVGDIDEAVLCFLEPIA
jgi:hypothetical protein